MILGFAAAATGDWFLAGPGHSFLWGVVAFSMAQVLWIAANARDGSFDVKLAVAACCPLAALFVWRVSPQVAGLRLGLMVGYAILSLGALGVAAGTRRIWYGAGIALLFVSDVSIALRMAKVPYWQFGIGPLYVAAIVCLVVSAVLDSRERRLGEMAVASRVTVGLWGLAAAAFFVTAAWTYPGAYNPFMMMLSRLGRTTLAEVDYPLCHYLFTFGMLVSATAVSLALGGWGGWLAASGLVIIAAVPENVSMVGHNAGCHLATLGGALALLARRKGRFGFVSMLVLFGVVGVFGACLALHALKVIPFAPAVPTLQKLLIVTFAVWAFLAHNR